MNKWKDTTVIITGGGSGIGRSLAKKIASQEAYVYVTDIDREAAEMVAQECGDKAVAMALDTRDTEAFRHCVDTVISKHGRIDFLFNNAGIGISGEAHDFPIQAWERIIDINIRGMANGIHSVYPIMLKQGSGHIINTASLAGLSPAPLLTPYTMTKHAIVGLSKSLRIEGATHGVRVSVLCPAAVETPMIDADNPTDLPSVNWKPNVRQFLTKLSGKPYPVECFAEDTLKAVEKNIGVIVIPFRARFIWRLERWFPKLVEKITSRIVEEERGNRL